jgi:hypothetical protein
MSNYGTGTALTVSSLKRPIIASVKIKIPFPTGCRGLKSIKNEQG